MLESFIKAPTQSYALASLAQTSGHSRGVILVVASELREARRLLMSFSIEGVLLAARLLFTCSVIDVHESQDDVRDW